MNRTKRRAAASIRRSPSLQTERGSTLKRNPLFGQFIDQADGFAARVFARFGF